MSLTEQPPMNPKSTDLSSLKIDWKDNGPSQGPNRRLHRVGRIGWLVLALVLVAGAAIGYRWWFTTAATVEMTTATAIPSGQAATILNASGYVVAQRRAAVASKATGRLLELRVKEGDRVTQGEILARLENADMAAALAGARADLNVSRSTLDQAKAELTDATLDYERKTGLFKSGLIPKADFDPAEARYRRALAGVASAKAGVNAAEAAVQAAQVEVENTIIRAPFDGTVLTKEAEVGEVVAPFGSAASAKAAVVTMADMSSLQVEADVSESNIQKITVGQRCEITLDAYPKANYEGIVQAIVPTVDRAKATVLTKIKFTNLDARVLPEMSARVSFLSEPPSGEVEPSRVAVNPAAIVSRGPQRVVYLVRGDRVEEVPVEEGGMAGSLAVMTHGLRAGDRVVLNPPESMRGGDRIRPSTP
jgi:HlyD family secretion protein